MVACFTVDGWNVFVRNDGRIRSVTRTGQPTHRQQAPERRLRTSSTRWTSRTTPSATTFGSRKSGNGIDSDQVDANHEGMDDQLRYLFVHPARISEHGHRVREHDRQPFGGTAVRGDDVNVVPFVASGFDKIEPAQLRNIQLFYALP